MEKYFQFHKKDTEEHWGHYENIFTILDQFEFWAQSHNSNIIRSGANAHV